jgi:hypothetical protein
MNRKEVVKELTKKSASDPETLSKVTCFTGGSDYSSSDLAFFVLVVFLAGFS